MQTLEQELDTIELQTALDKAVLGLFEAKAYASTFLTTIYCSLRFQWDRKITTACTNGIWLRINPFFFLELDPRARVSLLSHELWHIAFMHMVRVGDRDPKTYNMAADYAINLMLRDHGYFIPRNPDGSYAWLIDEKYRDMSAEQIYEDLRSNSYNVIYLPLGLDFQPVGGEIGGGFGNDIVDPMTQQQITEIIATITRAATAHNMCGGQGSGSLPGEFVAMMEELLRPRIKWGNRFSRWLTARNDDAGQTWQRPNRRFTDVYLPSKHSEGRLARQMYAIDASSSMSDKHLLIINSELKGVKSLMNPESMLVVSFDTMIHDIWEFGEDKDIESLKIHGRRGTDMRCIWELMAKEKPQALIMFSDMWCDIPARPKGIQVLWVCFDNPGFKPPYGDVIHIDTSRDP